MTLTDAGRAVLADMGGDVPNADWEPVMIALANRVGAALDGHVMVGPGPEHEYRCGKCQTGFGYNRWPCAVVRALTVEATMTVPSREEVVRAIAEKRWPDQELSDLALQIVHNDLDAQARAGFPALIGTTHEGCETCYGTGETISHSTHDEHGEWHILIPCPDGRPAYWTVTE